METEIKRIKNISQEDFLESYLTKGKPVIISDAMEKWNLEQFQPKKLETNFGDENVQVYNNLFELQTIKPLKKYFQDNFSVGKNTQKLEYIRWYSKLKNIDFFWSDKVFYKLNSEWATPYFMPENGYILPYSKDGSALSITTERFPYKGLFISGKGGRTRLHRDPFCSHAVLCQFYGKKEILLYAPDQANYLMNLNGEFVDPTQVDKEKFSSFNKAQLAYKTILNPGEIILFPSGWFHDVTSITNSISVTWNFVHKSNSEEFCDHIKNNPNDPELQTVRFFIEESGLGEMDENEFCEFINR